MSFDKESLNDDQKEVIEELDTKMRDLFGVFVKVDAVGIQISDALECIGMEVPLFARAAVNQLTGRLREMNKQHLDEELPAA